MGILSGIQNIVSSVQGVGSLLGKSSESDAKSDASAASDFESYLTSALIPNQENNVSEEALFSGLVGERIKTLKGQKAADKYKESLEKNKAAAKKADGFIPLEEAALSSLKEMVSSGVLTKEEADKIYSESFAAAQLDSNKDSLYDDRGGANDPTMAIAKIDAAIAAAKLAVEQIASGELKVTTRDSVTASPTGAGGVQTAALSASGAVDFATGKTVTPKGTTIDGADGFLFKPVTNNEQRLAVLLGAEMTGKVLGVILKDKEGKVIEEGSLQTAGISETGREKYTFSKKGGSYPDNIQVEVRFADGSVNIYNIPDPSKRYD